MVSSCPQTQAVVVKNNMSIKFVSSLSTRDVVFRVPFVLQTSDSERMSERDNLTEWGIDGIVKLADK